MVFIPDFCTISSFLTLLFLMLSAFFSVSNVLGDPLYSLELIQLWWLTEQNQFCLLK